MCPRCPFGLAQLLYIHDATETEGAGAALGGRHAQMPAMLGELVGLRGVPNKVLGLSVATFTKDRRSMVVIQDRAAWLAEGQELGLVEFCLRTAGQLASGVKIH